MGKVSPVSAKYIINIDIQIEGAVDKPDVIGAVFGQVEGFLGSDLELRELQRGGKIGRIEVDLKTLNGKTTGAILIPSSLDKAETAIIAAALETIERIGPCNSKVSVKGIDDVRIAKRDFVVNRAKELLRVLETNVLPDSQEIRDLVSQSVRQMEVKEWGPEKLPAGPMVNESEEIILVEGRADVLNLLKNGFKNVIAMNGTSVPESVKNLCKKKLTTAFVDGDRGGDLILRVLMETGNLDFAVKAPDGKEVEELTKKEIHLALRAKVAASQFRFETDQNGKTYHVSQKREFRSPEFRNSFSRNSARSDIRREAPQRSRMLQKRDTSKLKSMLDDLIGTRGAYLLDKDGNILGKVPTSELEASLGDLKGVVDSVVFDGVVTKEIAGAAERAGADALVAMESKVADSRVKIFTAKDL